MPSLNRVFLIGNLTRDPELRYTPGSNAAVCEFGIAVNRRFMQANGQEKDEPCFVDIVVWGKQAESSSRFLQKGASVFIEGRLVFDQWTEKETQKKRSRLRVTAERVQFLNGRREDGSEMPMEDDGGAPYQQTPRAPYSQQRQALRQDGPYRRQQYDAAPGGQPYQQQSYQQQSYQQPYQQQRPMPQNQSEPPMPDNPMEDVDDIPF